MKSKSALNLDSIRTRIDGNGHAFAGSQYQVQSYVNEHSAELSNAINKAFAFNPLAIKWVSPLSAQKYAEYQDNDFLRALGLDAFSDQLRRFWPRRGPCWDALARINFKDGHVGYLLVEAKSHLREIEGNGCSACEDSSLHQIHSSLLKTKEWLGVNPDADWTGKLYQSANRYAHLYFLRMIVSVNAYLANLYFLNDTHFSNSPKVAQDWQPALLDAKKRLGLEAPVPFTQEIFLDAFPYRVIASHL
jgi:hypothetical protein